MCLDTNKPVPKQMISMNELREHLYNVEDSVFMNKNVANMLIEEIDKYVIHFNENIINIMKNRISN